jgi:hypothetical protein
VEALLWDASDDSLTLTAACELGDDDRARAVLAKHPDLIGHLQQHDAARIVAAAELGNGEAVVRMLAMGWSPGVIEKGGVTALHWAGLHGDASTARALVAGRAPLDVKDHQFSATPLGWALWGSVNGWRRATGGYPDTVRAMLEAGAVPPPMNANLVASDEVKRVLTEFAARSAN